MKDTIPKVLELIEQRQASVRRRGKIFRVLKEVCDGIISITTSGHNMVYGSQFFANSVVSSIVGITLSGIATVVLGIQKKLKIRKRMRRYESLTHKLMDIQMSALRLAADGSLDERDVETLQKELHQLDEQDESGTDTDSQRS